MATTTDSATRPPDTPRRGRRERIRSTPGRGQAYRLAVFLAGLAFIALGLALAVLPGPLTIPPVLLGLWIWSTEFRFAARFFDSFRRKVRRVGARQAPPAQLDGDHRRRARRRGPRDLGGPQLRARERAQAAVGV